jgi:UDP-N-acetylglucosamine 2-epimerase
MALKILSVVGARPNFMKVAAIHDAIKEFNQLSSREEIQHVLVHTGQHYDANMSDFFFNDLELPKPDLFLGVGSASHSEQTAKIMERFEGVLLNEKPRIVIVVGDVNSTLACALVTKKTWCSTGGGGESYIPSRLIESSPILFLTIFLRRRKAPIEILSVRECRRSIFIL